MNNNKLSMTHGNFGFSPAFFFLLLFLLCSCNVSPKKIGKSNEETSNYLYSINTKELLNSTQNVKLSDIAIDIQYIPLETTKNSLINQVINVALTESFIFIGQQNNLLQFSSDGKFIKQIGSYGHGPGEYLDIMNFAVNEIANLILINDGYKCYKYDIEGDYKGELDVPSYYYFFYTPKRIAFYLINHIDKSDNLIIMNEQFVTLHTFQNQNPRPQTKLKYSRIPMYSFNNELYFKESYNDTVFQVKDSQLIPHITYNEKDLLIPKEFDLHPTGDIHDLKKQIEDVKDKLIMENILESNQYIFTLYQRGLDPRNPNYVHIFFNKETDKAFYLDQSELINDFDGGCYYWPTNIFQDSIMVNYITSLELKVFISTDDFKKNIPKYPEKKKALEKLANSLNENDNPVLMLVRLKE